MPKKSFDMVDAMAKSRDKYLNSADSLWNAAGKAEKAGDMDKAKSLKKQRQTARVKAAEMEGRRKRKIYKRSKKASK